MLEPLLFDSYDELIHVGTFVRLLDSHSLFPSNTTLPVSPYYPGLELATAATRWLTGLPLYLDELFVLAIIRIVLVLGVYLVIERVCRSPQAGGIGVLIYAASPQFYGFDAQYAYETIGLAFAVATVYLLFFTIDVPRPRVGSVFALALGSVVAVVISHHVTGWLTVGLLVAWFVGLYFTSHPFRRIKLAPTQPSAVDELTGISDWSRLTDTQPPSDAQQSTGWFLSRRKARAARRQAQAAEKAEFWMHRRAQARIIGLATALGLVTVIAWLLFVGHLLARYLGPVFSSAATELKEALGSGQGNRALFTSSSGGVSPKWEIALILLSTLGWILILLPSLYNVVFRRSIRGGVLRYIPVIIAAAYPLTVASNISPDAKTVGERLTTFIFFGVAVVVGAWMGQRILRDRRRIARVATIGIATVIFLGSFLYGIGPPVSILPGPYRVGGDSLSYGSPSLAVAEWANTHLPAGSHVAADRDNSVLLNAIGGVDAVTHESGLVNPELLYFNKNLSLFDIYLIRKADIRYIVVDDRLAQGLPLYGVYIAAGEPTTRLTSAQLDKFTRYSFVKRIYDNGTIQVYDVSGLLAPSHRAAPAGTPVGGSGLNVGIFILAGGVALLWALRLRRRRGRNRDTAHLIFCGLTCALLLGVFGAFLIRLLHAPPETVATVVLLLLLALSLRPPSWNLRNLGKFRDTPAEPAFEAPTTPAASNGSRSKRTGLLLGCVGVALFLVGAALATLPTLKDWTPPPELSIAQSTKDHSVAQVQLGSVGPVQAKLEITEAGNKVVWHTNLAKTTGVQRVDLPADLLHKGSRVELLARGQDVRWVNGWVEIEPPPTAGSSVRF